MRLSAPPPPVAAAPPVARAERIAILAIIGVAAALRLAALDRIPPAMNQDEVIKGYDAWCLRNTAADYRGTPWPAFLGSFGPGDSPSAVSAWLTAPFVGLRGLNVTAVRLPIALCGIATVALLWWWMRRCIGVAGALAAAAILAVCPWHHVISRLAFEGNLAPFLITLGLALLLAPGIRRPRLAACLGGLALGIAVWSYHAPRLAVPLIALAAWFILARRDASSRPRLRWAIAGALLGAAPLLLTLATHPEKVFGRAAQLALVRTGSGPSAPLLTFARHYLAHFDPRVLFLTGDAHAHQIPPGFGFLHYYEAPLLLIGAILILLRARRDPLARFLIAWWLIYPLPASLARDVGPHAIRDAVGLPLHAIIEGIAAQWLVARAARWSRAIRVEAAVAAGLAAAGNVAWYANYYFRVYPAVVADAFQSELPPAFAWLRDHGGDYDLALFTFPANQPFAYFLFFTRVDPRTAQSATVHRDAWALGYEEVLQFDRVFFCPARGRRAWEQADIDRILATLPPGRRVLLLARPEQPLQGRPLVTIRGPAGRAAIVIRELQTPSS